MVASSTLKGDVGSYTTILTGVLAVLSIAHAAGTKLVLGLIEDLRRTQRTRITLVKGQDRRYEETVGDLALGRESMGDFRWIGQLKEVNSSLVAMLDLGLLGLCGVLLVALQSMLDASYVGLLICWLSLWLVVAAFCSVLTVQRLWTKLLHLKAEALDPDNMGGGIVDVDSRVDWLTSRTHWLVAQYGLGWVHPGESAAAKGWQEFWSEDVTSLQALDEAEFDAFLAKQYRIQNFALVSKKGWEVLMAHQAVDTISDPLKALRSYLRSKEGWPSEAGSALRAMCEDSYQSRLEFELGAAVGFEFNCCCGSWLCTEEGRSRLAGVVVELRGLMKEAEDRKWACAQSKAQVVERLARVACFWEEVLKAV